MISRCIRFAGKPAILISKRLWLKDLTTRKHYPGARKVEVIVNGEARPLGKFELLRIQGEMDKKVNYRP